MLQENENNYSPQSGSETTEQPSAFEETQAAEEEQQSPFFGAQNPYTAPYVPNGYTENTLREKRDIRRIARISGICFICTYLIMSFWYDAYVFVMTLLGFSQLQAHTIITESASLELVQILLSSVAFLAPFTIAAKAAGGRISELVPLGRPKKGTALPYFLIGVGFCAVANIASSIASQIFEEFGLGYEPYSYDTPKGTFGFILVLISTAVVPALVEEFACRGVVFGFLEKYGQGFAIMVSSVLFGIMHGNLGQIPFAFLVGLAVGLIRVKTGTLWICIAVHSWNNLMSVVFSSLEDYIPTQYTNIIYTLYLTLALTVSIIGLSIISKRQGSDAYTLEEPDCEASEKKKSIWFFTSCFIIIFMVLELYNAFSQAIGYIFS